MKGLAALLELTSFRVALVVALLLGLGLCAVPLFGVHGLESALVLGVVLPTPCALVAARLALRARAEASAGRAAWTSGVLLGRALGAAGCVLLLPVVVLALNALRVRNCEPLEGLAFIVLGPGFGCALAAAWGVTAGSLPSAPRAGTALALLGPLGEIALALHGLYATPAVFAYGYFFGYFPGSLYDELIAVPWPLLVLRAVTAVAFAGLLALVVGHREASSGVLRAAPLQGHWPLGAVALTVAALVVLATGQRQALGWASSTERIAEQVGGAQLSSRCELIVPAEMRRERRDRLARDCDFRVAQAERFFGVSQKQRIRVLYFRNALEKKQLMGAAGTNIAKPWRGEIYLQDEAFPHTVLAHEIAHIVAGNIGRGPMRVSGPLGGLLPDLGLVEGVAVAAAWSSSAAAGLSPHQWTRAMLELGIAPRLHEVLGLTGFLGQQKRLAYTLVGSLVRYVHDTRGPAAVRALYMDGDVARALGVPLSQLEEQWHAYVRAVPLPERARSLATLRFSGRSVLVSVCPHERAELKQELAGQLAAALDGEAAATCRAVLELDPGDAGVRSALVSLLARRGELPAAREQLEVLGELGPAVLAAGRHALADELFRAGAIEEARATYRALLAEPSERDALRLLQVKALALEGGERQQRLLFELLIGEPGVAAVGAYAVYLARELRAERDDGLPHYLESRQLFFQERFGEAAELLQLARERGLPTPELAAEALRVEAVARAALGERAEARVLFTQLAAAPAELGYAIEADDWLQRLAFEARRR